MSEPYLYELERVFWGDTREQPTRVRLARVVDALAGHFGAAAILAAGEFEQYGSVSASDIAGKIVKQIKDGSE